MTILGDCIFLMQNVLILLTLRHVVPEVLLTSSELTCGQPAVLNCRVNPLDGITWQRNSVPLLECYDSGLCDFVRIGNMSFSVDVSSFTYTITINPLEYHAHENDIFHCGGPSGAKSLTLNVTVPLTAVVINTEETKTGMIDINAATNCLRLRENVTFTWTCVSVKSNQTVPGICNFSVVTVSVNASSCNTDGFCTGAGLQKQIHTLTFENYTDPVDTEDVRIQVTVTNIDGKSVTDTSREIFRLQKAAPSYKKNKTKIVIIYILAVLLLVNLVVAWVIVMKKFAKLKAFGCDNPAYEQGKQRRNDASNEPLERSTQPSSYLKSIEVHSPTEASTNRSDTEKAGTVPREDARLLARASEVSEGEKASRQRSDIEKEDTVSREDERLLARASEVSEGEKASRQWNISERKNGSRQRSGPSDYDDNVESEEISCSKSSNFRNKNEDEENDGGKGRRGNIPIF